jgi:hypothetical protein
VNYVSVVCNIQMVSGGINPVALNVSGDASVKSLTSDEIPMDPGIVPLSLESRQPVLAHANDIAPAEGDLCIRYRALLI